MLPAAVARSSSGGITKHRVLPVLWMTSCIHIINPMAACRSNSSVVHGLTPLWRGTGSSCPPPLVDGGELAKNRRGLGAVDAEGGVRDAPTASCWLCDVTRIVLC